MLKKVKFDSTTLVEAEAALREAKVLAMLRHPHVVPYMVSGSVLYCPVFAILRQLGCPQLGCI